MSGRVSVPGDGVVPRVLRLLFAFDDRHRQLSLTELSRRADLPLPTAHRLVGDLVAGGALRRRPSGEYVVARRLWSLGLLAPLQGGLRQAAAPFLNDIHATTRATVHLGIRERAQVLYLERLSGRASVPVVSTVGSRLPLHSTGVGKVLLAYAPEEVQARALAEPKRFTQYTVTQPDRLRRQLREVREQGYATTHQEMTLGACSLAVPVRLTGRREGMADPEPATIGSTSGGADASVVAAVGVVVPSLRSHRARLLAALQVAAQGIGRSIEAGPAH
jgi:DNA-binding IclR family transcriptional regulator